MNHNLLEFDMTVGRQKPETIVHTDHYCPFSPAAPQQIQRTKGHRSIRTD